MTPYQRLDSLLNLANQMVRNNAYAAEPLLQTALTLADSLKQPLEKAKILNSMGAMYTQQDEYAKSLDKLQEAERILINLKSDTLLIDTYTNLGILQEKRRQWQAALDYYQKVADILVRTKAPELERARNLTNTAHVLEEQGKLEEARDTYLQALKISESINHPFAKALISQNLANVHNGLRKWKESIAYSEKSIAIAKEHNLPRIVAAGLENTATTYLLQELYAEAIGYFLQAYDSASRIGYNKTMLNASLQLSVCYEKTGNLAKALSSFRQYTQLKDSILNADKLDKLEGLQAAYDARNRENAIRELQQQQNLARIKQERSYIGIGALLVALGLTVAYTKQRAKRRKAEADSEKAQLEARAMAEKQNLERQKMFSELNALKAQMNPHFLFNVLNSIQDLFMSGKNMLANEQLGKFSDLTRAILDASGRQAISLHEEMDMLRNYLDLEGLRFEEGFSYNLTVEPGLDLYGTEIPPMLVQPYVENAIKHGLLHKTGDRKVDVAFTKEKPDLLKVTITDNGVGRQQAAYFQRLRQKKHAGFATTATQKRLELLNHGRSEAITVNYTDLTGTGGASAGTMVTLFIPIQE
ncbi:MAG: tetratricopeptide repeat protein [Chitinophagaceae bacterium]|nr:tetratricopeptide repeat protein [Chitinophagaceae bacterium]